MGRSICAVVRRLEVFDMWPEPAETDSASRKLFCLTSLSVVLALELCCADATKTGPGRQDALGQQVQ